MQTSEKELSVDQLEPGYILSKPVKKDNSILYSSGKKLSLEDIVLLKNWRIPSVKVDLSRFHEHRQN